MLRIIAGILFSFALMTGASAQSCNDPSGFLKTYGTINLGDNLVLGPDCQHAQSGSSGGLLLTNNIWIGDNFFGSGRPWCDVRAMGAKGDNVTDDHNAFVACRDKLIAQFVNGGTIYVPPSAGLYCDKIGTTYASNGIILMGAAGSNSGNSAISSCGANNTTVTLNGFGNRIESLMIIGPGITGSVPALALGSSCTECIVNKSRVLRGSFAIDIKASDYHLTDLHVEQAYSTAIIRTQNGGGYMDRVKSDQLWPVSTPAYGTAFAAWAAATAYTTGTVVSSGGFYIQATKNGTSGGTPPVLQDYNVNIVDNTETWQLVAPTTYYSHQLDTGTVPMFINGGDYTGPFTGGIALTNTLAGNAPQSVTITNATFGANTGAGLLLLAGNAVTVTHSQFASCISTGCAGISAGTAWAGDLTISDNTFLRLGNSINIATGVNTLIASNKIFGSAVSAVNFAANLNVFSIVGNNFSTNAAWGTNLVGINIAAGTSDHYNIIGNNLFGATTPISNGATGTNRAVWNEAALNVANGGTGLQAGTSGGIPCFNSASTMISSVAMSANVVMVGGGAGACPATGGVTLSGSDLSSVNASSNVAALPQFILRNNVADVNPASFLFQKNRASGNTNAGDAFLDMQGYGFANAAQQVSARWQAIQTAAATGSNIPTKQVWSNSSPSGLINQTMTFDDKAHFSVAQATAPTLTAGCNGAGSSVAGSDFAGTVTGQTAAATTCTVTFGTTFASAPTCTVAGLSSPLTGAVTIAAATLVVNFASTANYKFTYICSGV